MPHLIKEFIEKPTNVRWHFCIRLTNGSLLRYVVTMMRSMLHIYMSPVCDSEWPALSNPVMRNKPAVRNDSSHYLIMLI